MATLYRDAAALLKHFAHNLTSGIDALDHMLRVRNYYVHIPADTIVETGEYQLLIADKDVDILVYQILPSAAVTANDTDYKGLDLGKGDAAGGALTSLKALTTKITGGTGDWVKGTAIAGLSATDKKTLTAGQRLSLVMTEAGDGVVLPDMCIWLQLRYQ